MCMYVIRLMMQVHKVIYLGLNSFNEFLRHFNFKTKNKLEEIIIIVTIIETIVAI